VTIGVYETENHSDFQRVPDDLTLAEAAGMLNRQTVVADIASASEGGSKKAGSAIAPVFVEPACRFFFALALSRVGGHCVTLH
jgi:hypothetical protein